MDISRIVCQRLTSYIEISILPKASVNAEIIRPLISQTTLAYILIHVFARSRRYDFRVAHHSPPPLRRNVTTQVSYVSAYSTS